MRRAARRSDPAAELLAALRAAGCEVFFDDGQLFVSPPLCCVVWAGDIETAIETWYDELTALVAAEVATMPCATTIH